MTDWSAHAVPPSGTRIAVAGGCGGIGRATAEALAIADARSRKARSRYGP
jgi:NAD(P)-dependent dehydrogenase (short-subunit alcohol dehydrogenase family)